MFAHDKHKKIKDFLEQLGANKVPHVKGKTLYDHFIRVSDILTSWGLSDDVVKAGMCHSVYATEAFKTMLLSVDERDKLRKVIGVSSEVLVFAFCQIKRSTFEKINSGYTFISYIDNKVMKFEKEEFIALLHILLANEIDHLDFFNVSAMSSSLGAYLQWDELLCEKARKYLKSLSVNNALNLSVDSVRFIAHSGVHISTKNGIRVTIDPWIYPSTRQNPKIQGFDPTSFTIDYLIPEPRNIIKDIESDIILLSHFHTHHSPFQEIKELVTMREVDLVCPILDSKKLIQIERALGSDLFNKITFHFVTQDTTLKIKGLEVRCLTHSHAEHFAYFVKTESVSVLHIADAAASKNSTSLMFDDFWKKFYGLEPDFFFVSAGGHSLRRVGDKGSRVILENTTLTPVQAAKLTVNVGARNVGLVGVYNFSAWDNRVEYSRTYEAAESELYWAMSFLSPATRVYQFRPGDTFYPGT